MDKNSTQRYRILPLVVISFILLIGTFYSTNVRATNSISQSPGTQLAYYNGWHGGGWHRGGWGWGGGYYGVGYGVSNVYWTGWRYYGRHCQRSCLVNRWNGHVIRCHRRCF